MPQIACFCICFAVVFFFINSATVGLLNLVACQQAYLEMLGAEGCKVSTQVAILAANYLRERLKDAYDVLFTDHNGLSAHEFILDLRTLKKDSGCDCVANV